MIFNRIKGISEKRRQWIQLIENILLLSCVELEIRLMTHYANSQPNNSMTSKKIDVLKDPFYLFED